MGMHTLHDVRVHAFLGLRLFHLKTFNKQFVWQSQYVERHYLKVIFEAVFQLFTLCTTCFRNSP